MGLRISGYVLGVTLLALVGWCMVQESVNQTQARYRLADLSRREDEVKKRLDKLRTQEQALRSPSRLAALVRENNLSLVALGSIQPESPAWSRQTTPSRRPGQVLDEEYARAAETDTALDLAGIGRW